MAHVLVVEDNIEYAQSLIRALGEFGHDVTLRLTAESAYEVLDRTEGVLVDCVITDMRLGPGDHGDGVLERIAQMSKPLPTLLHSRESLYSFSGKFPTLLELWIRRYASFARFRRKEPDLGYVS